MDSQDMNQAGLAGEFLAETEHQSPEEQPQAVQAIGVSSSQSAEEESAAAQKRANCVLAVLFLAGMGVVYFMSMQKDPDKVNPLEQASETIVNAAVLQFKTDPGALTGKKPGAKKPEISPAKLAREMITGTSERQVPLEDLKNNPFVLDRNSNAPKDPAVDKPVGPAPRESALQRAQALQLQSIVISDDRSLAIISDRLLGVGQEIAGWKVQEIGKGQVTLQRRDQKYILRVKR